jgi:RimJ/RimL family protein N-acetyltransferase
MRDAKIITTARLTLRPIEREDGPHLLRLVDNWNVAQWLTRVPWPYRMDDMVEFIEEIALPRQDGPKPVMAIILEGMPIGAIVCCGHPDAAAPLGSGSELGYWLGEPYWGRGYMTEAVAAMVDRTFAAADAAVIRSGVIEGNAASLRIQQKLGFEISGSVMVDCRPRGEEVRLICTRLTRERHQAFRRD